MLEPTHPDSEFRLFFYPLAISLPNSDCTLFTLPNVYFLLVFQHTASSYATSIDPRMCYVNILIPPTRFRTGRTRSVHFRTFRGPFFTRSHQFRPGSDPFRSFSRADGSRTCAGHVASRLRRCYGFILFRFPALMSRAVAVSVVVRHPFTCIASPCINFPRSFTR